MTNEEAVMELETIKPALDYAFIFSVDKKAEAIDMAIKALKEPKCKNCDLYFIAKTKEEMRKGGET